MNRSRLSSNSGTVENESEEGEMEDHSTTGEDEVSSGQTASNASSNRPRSKSGAEEKGKGKGKETKNSELSEVFTRALALIDVAARYTEETQSESESESGNSSARRTRNDLVHIPKKVSNAMEELASILEDMEKEYSSMPGRSPIPNKSDMENMVKCATMILQDEDLLTRLEKFLQTEKNYSLHVRVAATRLLLALLPQQAQVVDCYVNFATLLMWGYGDAFLKYENSRSDSNNSVSKAPSQNQNTTDINIDSSSNNNRRRSSVRGTTPASSSAPENWFATGAEGRRLKSDTRFWWKSDPKNAQRLRQYATGLLSYAVAEGRHVAISVLDEYPTHGIVVPFPRVLLRRLKTELFPRWKSKAESDELKCVLRFIAAIGVYQEILGDILTESTLNLVQELLDLNSPKPDVAIQYETLDLLSRIVVHKKVALRFVEDNGVENLLELSQTTKSPAYLHGQLVYCLASLTQLSVVIEKIAQRPDNLSEKLMKFVISLLSNPQDMARLNALEFLSSFITVPANLETFDSMHGPRKVMDCLASPIVPQQLGKVMQLVKVAMFTLRQYFRVHVALAAHVVRVRTKKRRILSQAPDNLHNPRARGRSVSVSSITSTSSASLRPLPEDKPIRVDDKAHQANMSVLSQNRQVVIPYLTATKWTPVEEVLKYEYVPVQNTFSPNNEDDEDGRTEDQGDGVNSTNVNDQGSSPNKRATGIGLLMSIIMHSTENGTPAALDSTTLALEILRIITMLPFTYELVCCRKAPTSSFSGMLGDVNIPEPDLTGISVLLDAALSAHHPDPRVTVASLEVLCNCCTPARGIDRAQRNVRSLARHQNALMALLALLRYDHTPSSADRVHYLSCLVLLGLARDKRVAQVLDSLQIASTLSRIARSDPVLVENIRIHKKLRKACLELIQLATGRLRVSDQKESDEKWLAGVVSEAADATKSKIERVSVVSRTEVTFDSKELLYLIKEHLESRGLTKAAQELTTEAGLTKTKKSNVNRAKRPHYDKSHHVLSTTHEDESTEQKDVVILPEWPSDNIITEKEKLKLNRAKSRKPLSQLPCVIQTRSAPPNTETELALSTKQNGFPALSHGHPRRFRSPRMVAPSGKYSKGKVRSQRMNGPSSSAKRKRKRVNSDNTPLALPLSLQQYQGFHQPIFDTHNRKDEKMFKSMYWRQRQRVLHSNCNPSTRLEKIVQEHLKEQHRNCPNPVGLVPTFSLLDGNRHQCPSKTSPTRKFTNIAKRLHHRQISQLHGTHVWNKLNSEFIHGRSRWMKSYRISGNLDEDMENDYDEFSCVRFYSPNGIGSNFQSSYSDELLCGTVNGDVICFNTMSCKRIAKWSLCNSQIQFLRTTPDGRGLITCDRETGTASYWQINQDDRSKTPVNLVDYRCDEIELDSTGRRLLGTNVSFSTSRNNARLYDVATGKLLNQFDGINQYQWQRSSFGPNDRIVCVDGMLWDVRARHAIHKFDKLSRCGFSAFHPTGNQLVINSTIWDLRTFKLFLTCKTFQESVVQFNQSGNVAYSYRYNNKVYQNIAGDKTINVTDALYYNNIATNNIDRHIQDLCLDPYGEHFAVVAQKAPHDAGRSDEPSACRLYEIGRVKPDDDDSDIDEARSESEESDSSDGEESDENDHDDDDLSDNGRFFLWNSDSDSDGVGVDVTAPDYEPSNPNYGSDSDSDGVGVDVDASDYEPF